MPETTKTMNQSIFRRRRQRFARSLGAGVALLPAAPARTRSNDVEYPYRQDSDFYYLTGFPEPEAVAVLRGADSGGAPKYMLFVRPRDPALETWNGPRAGVEGACRTYGANQAYTIDELDTMLPQILESAEHVHLAVGKYPEFDNRVTRVMDRQRWQSRRGVRVAAGIVDAREILHEMRLVKGAEDLKLLRRAAAISCEAHLAAMRACRPGMHEYELAALVEYVFQKHGAESPGYPTIVGSGANATILHYVENRRRMRDGDLVLIDAGAEFSFFSADVTRTFPVNGRFTTAQRQIYAVVLAAQKAAIAAARPGSTLKRMHDAAVGVVVGGLADLGILRGDPRRLVKNGDYRRFFMHGTSHWLGMDVHDVGRYREGTTWRALEPGMVMTVEPGIYIAPGTDDVPRRYRGIGVRIEDDVLVTRGGHQVLTAAAPKEIDEVERAMAEPLRIAV